MSDWLAAEATYYRSRDTAAARFLAAQLDALREEAEALDALTVDQYEGRAHARQREHDERLKDQGYAMGRIDERAGPLR